MATLTVRNLEEDLVRSLRVRAAQNGRSAEAEHREILRANLIGRQRQEARQQAADRLAIFRRRIDGRGSPSAAALLEESRAERVQSLVERDEGS